MQRPLEQYEYEIENDYDIWNFKPVMFPEPLLLLVTDQWRSQGATSLPKHLLSTHPLSPPLRT